MAFLGQFRLFQVACPRLSPILVRTILELCRSDREFLLSWPFAEKLGWSRTKPTFEWTRCKFEGDRVVQPVINCLSLTSVPKTIGLTALQDLTCSDTNSHVFLSLTSVPNSIGLLALQDLTCSDTNSRVFMSL